VVDLGTSRSEHVKLMVIALQNISAYEFHSFTGFTLIYFFSKRWVSVSVPVINYKSQCKMPIRAFYNSGYSLYKLHLLLL
jgi:hypothetical protein